MKYNFLKVAVETCNSPMQNTASDDFGQSTRDRMTQENQDSASGTAAAHGPSTRVQDPSFDATRKSSRSAVEKKKLKLKTRLPTLKARSSLTLSRAVHPAVHTVFWMSRHNIPVIFGMKRKNG